MQPIHFFGVMLAGVTLGGLVGVFTRPSFLGGQPPLSILFSSIPADAPFRQGLMVHLSLCTGIGAVAAGLLLFFITYILNNRQPRA